MVKLTYAERISGQLCKTRNIRPMWRGVQALTHYKVVIVSTADTQRTLVMVNPRKAAGPDKFPGRVLRDCAGVRADVRTDIFKLSQPGHSNKETSCILSK